MYLIITLTQSVLTCPIVIINKLDPISKIAMTKLTSKLLLEKFRLIITKSQMRTNVQSRVPF